MDCRHTRLRFADQKDYSRGIQSEVSLDSETSLHLFKEPIQIHNGEGQGQGEEETHMHAKEWKEVFPKSPTFFNCVDSTTFSHVQSYGKAFSMGILTSPFTLPSKHSQPNLCPTERASHIFTISNIAPNKICLFVVLFSSKRKVLLLPDTSIPHVTHNQPQKPFQVRSEMWQARLQGILTLRF